jgi:hypothetical protein
MWLGQQPTTFFLQSSPSTIFKLERQWVENNPSNICIFPMDIRFYRRSLTVLRKRLLRMLTAFADVKYGCCRMLDGLVSTHPLKDQ